MTSDKSKFSDGLNKSDINYNISKSPLDRLSSEERHTIWHPYAKESEQTKSPSDSGKIDMQIEKQTNDMKRDIHERALIKEFVSDFLLSERGLPIESGMLQAIPQDEHKKLRFPVNQREAQAMKQLIDACYTLDDFVTKMKSIENHLTDFSNNTENRAVIPYSKKKISKKRQVLELVKNRITHIKVFYNLIGLQKSIKDIEKLLNASNIENDKGSDLELNGDNLVNMWAKYVVADIKYEVKSHLEWHDQIKRYGIFGGPKDPEDWEHASGTGPKDVAKIAQNKIKDKIIQILPKDSIVRRKLIERSITHIDKQIDMIEEYEINKYLYGNKHDNEPYKIDYDLDPETVIDFTKIKKHKGNKHENNDKDE